MSGLNLNDELLASLKPHIRARRLLIAYSGGLDSRVLLHLVATHRALLGCELEAIHIDHGLQSINTDWAEYSVKTCASYGIACQVLNANLQPQPGESVEALARDKRYELFASIMQEHDVLLLAQHADDQAETVLLQLLRGAGPEGLSAMPISRTFAKGHLVRPLLQASRANLKAYASNQRLEWIEDPTNSDDRFDRNYLRQHIFPKIEARFPGYRKTVARSASHCAELVCELSASVDHNYLACIKDGTDILKRSALTALPPNSQKQVLRSWIKRLGQRAPQSHQLSLMLEAFCTNSPDPAAAVTTSYYQIRRYQDGLYLLTELPKTRPFAYSWTDLATPLRVPEINTELSLQSLLMAGLKLDPDMPTEVRSRAGGEKLLTVVGGARRSIKKLFQECAIPPWERDKLPCIFQNDKLVAVLGLAIDPEFKASPEQPLHVQTKIDSADSL